jgi:hypothetical protein
MGLRTSVDILENRKSISLLGGEPQFLVVKPVA